MLKLYLYGYSGGAKVRSSRKLEAECKRNIELIWLTEDLKPSHATIAAFRKAHAKELKEVFKKFGLFLKSEGLVQGNEVCTDGTKLRGVNSKANNYTEKDVDSYLEWIDKITLEYLQQLDEADREEEKSGINPLSVKQGAVKSLLKKLQEKNDKYDGLKIQMQQTQNTQVSPTDAGTRLMQRADGGSTIQECDARGDAILTLVRPNIERSRNALTTPANKNGCNILSIYPTIQGILCSGQPGTLVCQAHGDKRQ